MILIWLPTKSLLRMKAVCSIWRDMISDPHFIKSHLDRANDIHNLCLKRYINYGPTMKSFGLEDRITRYEHTIPVTKFSESVEIFGSCNGLLLLGDDDHTYYLWNPSTRLLRSFSGLSIQRKQLRNFALGYDSKTSAYKFIRIMRVNSEMYDLSTSNKTGYRPRSHNDKHYDVTKAHMYNFKTGCWKMIEDLSYLIFEDAQGVTVNGAPHWVVFRDHHGEDDVIDLVIVYFDLTEEKFIEIPKPSWLEHSSIYEFGVFEGKLCFIHHTKPREEIWVMQKHGEESWINVSSVVGMTRVCLPGWSSSKNVNNLLDFNAFGGAQYVESLVSPYGGGDMIG